MKLRHKNERIKKDFNKRKKNIQCGTMHSTSLYFFYKIKELEFCRLFGAKCMRCGLPVQSTDYVYRVFASVYHLHCFKCFCCGHLFKKGDHYMLVDGQIICRADYEHLLCQTPICQSHCNFFQFDIKWLTVSMNQEYVEFTSES